MKKLCTTLLISAIVLSANADQFLKVTPTNGEPSYFSANGDLITFKDGESVTIQGVTFKLSELKTIEVVNEYNNDLDDNTVQVVYAGNYASVLIASNITDYVTYSVDGANVTVDQLSTDSDNPGEIFYVLKGESDNGSFILNGSYKCEIDLEGLTLASKTGAAIDIQNGKRVKLSAKKDTENTLSDSSDGKQKAALYCKGHLELQGKGVLNVTGNTGHAISAKEYIEMKNCTINVLGSVKDGMNCNQYFSMESGTINILKTGDDGIQVSYKDDEGNREEEDTSTLTVKDGTINIENVTNAGSKGMKSDNDIVIDGGDITILTTAAGTWDETNLKTKASSCLSADGDFTINGGTLSLEATGAGGKCISCDGTFYSNGGNVSGVTTGGALVYANNTLYQGNYTGNLDNINSDYKSSPKAIKADTEAILNAGVYTLSTKGKNGEGIESKGNLTFQEPDAENPLIVTIRAYDDGTNSSSNTYIKGGTLDVMSTGAGDGIDANANIYISGGRTMVFSSNVGSEQGLDSGDGNYGTYITGGELLSRGAGGNGQISSTTGSQPFINASVTLTANAEVEISQNGSVIGSFTIPSDFSTSGSTGGNSGPQGAPGGNMGGSNGVLISLPGMVTGQSYTVTVNGTSTTATAQASGSTGGMGGRP